LGTLEVETMSELSKLRDEGWVFKYGKYGCVYRVRGDEERTYLRITGPLKYNDEAGPLIAAALNGELVRHEDADPDTAWDGDPCPDSLRKADLRHNPYTEPVPEGAKVYEISLFRNIVRSQKSRFIESPGHGHPAAMVHKTNARADSAPPILMNPRITITAENAVERECTCRQYREACSLCHGSGTIPSAIPDDASHVAWISK
jgi:hypothetical protein